MLRSAGESGIRSPSAAECPWGVASGVPGRYRGPAPGMALSGAQPIADQLEGEERVALSETVRIVRVVRFSAAHRYHSDQLTDAENQRVFGKCNRVHGHGHDYRVEVGVEGSVDPVTGMVMNLATLDEILRANVVDPLDHSFLNFDVPHFAHVVPTCENIALYVQQAVRPALEAAAMRLSVVRVWEGEDLFAEVGSA